MLPYVAWPSGFNIPPAKITHYLPNTAGHSPAKARWWLSQGFSTTQPQQLIAALFEYTSAANLVGLRIPPRLWGHRLVFEGPIRMPGESFPTIRSVWQIGYGTPNGQSGIADFVTAHRI